MDPSRTSVLGRFAGRVGQYAAIFGAGSAASVVLGLALVAFVTRHLPPDDYGELAVYLLVPSLIMVVANLGSLQGTMGAVLHQAGDEGIEIEVGPRADAGDPRRVLGTGLLLTLAVGVVLGAMVWLLAAPIAEALGNRTDGETLVRIGAIGGAIGGGWRLLSNFLRYSRRPVAAVMTNLTRPALALGFAVPLVEHGDGVKGVVLAFTLATACAFLVALAWVRRDIRPGFSAGTVREIYTLGGPLMPVGLSFWAIQSADVYAVSLAAGPTDAGVYRVASTISRAASYLVAAVTQALPPVFNSPLRTAVEREDGREATAIATLTAYSLVAPWAVVALAALADQLVRIAPTSFSSAASLVPVLALVPIGRGWLVASYMSSQLPHRRPWLAVLAVAALVVWVGLLLVLGPPLGRYGVAAAGPIAFLAAGSVLVLLGQRSPQRVAIPWRRVLAGPAIGAGLVVAVRLVADRVGLVGQLVAAVLAICAYPALLVAVGAIPAGTVRAGVHSLARSGFLRRRRDVAARLATLEPADILLLQGAVNRRSQADTGAHDAGMTRAELDARLHLILRGLAGVDPARPTESAVVRYLLFDGPAAERAALARNLVEDGSDPLAIDQLEVEVAEIRRLPPRRWPRLGG